MPKKRGVCVVIGAIEEGPAGYRGAVAFLYYPAREIIHNTGSNRIRTERGPSPTELREKTEADRGGG